MRSNAAAAVCLLLAVTAACGSGPVPATPQGGTQPQGFVVMHWRFDATDPLVGLDGPGGRRDTTDVAAANGGTVRAVQPGAGGSASAVGFPALCDGEACPRLAVTGPDDPGLDPGPDPFAYGASVLVTQGELSGEHGSNIVQKGLSSSAQWKLQIDSGSTGRPSCVLRATDAPDAVVATSTAGVADGSWHRVECHRTATALEVVVDDVVVGSTPVPAGWVVDTAGHPLTLGAKGAGPNNDQFHGVLDDVWFSLL